MEKGLSHIVDVVDLARPPEHVHFIEIGSLLGRHRDRDVALIGNRISLALVAMVVGALAPILQVAGWLSPIATLGAPVFGALGTVAAVVGIATTLWAQESMGDSWRIGVDAGETTQLVDRGMFGWVRNPIFTAMLIFGAGVALMAPNPLAIIGFVLLLTSIELQVRFVEEPYLHRTHSERYRDYVGRVGRFVPRIGRSPVRGPSA